MTLSKIVTMKESISRPRFTGASQEVEFALHAPEAKKVSIAGKFNDWNTNSLSMRKSKDGTWRMKIKLSPGRHEYKYFVDGTWAQNIQGAKLVPNPFGTYNCIIGIE